MTHLDDLRELDRRVQAEIARLAARDGITTTTTRREVDLIVLPTPTLAAGAALILQAVS